MLTKEEVLEQVKAGREGGCSILDGRDYARLVQWFPVEEWTHFGFTLKEGAEAPEEPKPWTREAIMEQLARDLAFGFEKALGRRGISASLMWEVVKMWMWVLDDKELAESEDYAQYGLPLFRAVAVKYGLPNQIGEDRGDEWKYSSEADY